MKIVITGVCGRLGRAIAILADEQGHQVIGMDIADWPTKRGPQPSSLKFIKGSYEDGKLLDEVLPGCDAIVHTGGPHGACMETHDTADFIEAHNVWVARMLDAARSHGVKSAVLSSTMEVQIGRDWAASGAAFVDENAPARCDSKYSLSRYLMETLAQQYVLFHPEISIACLRYMAFGYGDDGKAGPSLLSRTVPVRDVARAVLMAAARTDLKGDVFNIGPKTPLTASDIGQALSDPQAVLEKYYPGATEIVQNAGQKVTRHHFWPITSIRKAKLILGWEPEYSFEVWLRENGWQPNERPTVAQTV